MNESWAVYPKTGPVNGTPTYQSTLQKWFGTADTANVFDPHLIFDPKTSRYAMIAEDGKNWLLSVAQGSVANPATTVWCSYVVPARTNINQFADFPQLGSDSRYFYLTMVDLVSGSQTDSVLTVVPKSEAESCKTVHWSSWSQLRDPGTACALCTQDNLAFHVSPATVSDSLDGNGWSPTPIRVAAPISPSGTSTPGTFCTLSR